ncbi:hypothetical protein THF1C08_180040 [Vibrio jasicida]|uniref:Uncharacterized protein n=1 Tax=Vibrio jasicida TaxID=766224 RepID=A0AAU9QI22_9VIBR|nr:hypothetical protein THF1C08_180040 [Vibrio jasicida]CAH1581362.1 hypothetical protein THF1A12_170041 [Vibrio jasicida]
MGIAVVVPKHRSFWRKWITHRQPMFKSFTPLGKYRTKIKRLKINDLIVVLFYFNQKVVCFSKKLVGAYHFLYR